MSDPVTSPQHYNVNGIEVIDVIETYAKSDFRLANVIKYVCRCEYKGNKLQDLQKAHWYLNRVIEELAIEERDKLYQTFQPSPSRIAGDDDAALKVKNDYYEHEPDEVVGHCEDCAHPLTAGGGWLVYRGDRFCSLACMNNLYPEDER